MFALALSLVVVGPLTAPLIGHVGQDQFGKFPFVRDGVLVGGGTSWGLVRQTPGGGPDDWQRVCEESFGPVVFFAVDQGERGVLLGGIDGMFRSIDGGCTYVPLENELQGEFVSASWFDPADADHMMVGTSTNNSNNALWESFDGGDSFTELRAAGELSYFNVTVSEDGEFIAANAVDTSVANDGHNLLFFSDDAGASFVAASDVVDAYPVVHALGFDGHDLLLGGLQPSTQGFVDRVVFDGVSATATRIGETPREVRQGVVFQDALYVIANNGTRGELYKENDSDLGFGAVDGGPSDCVFVKDGVLFGCGKQAALNTSLFLRSTDGAVWTQQVNFFDIQYQLCPEGTVGRDNCASFIELFCGDGNDNDFSDGTDCEDPDCDTNPICTGVEGEGEEGEGEEGEGEGAQSEGEGEEAGEGDVGGDSCCAGSPSQAVIAGAALLVLRRRRRR